MADYKERRRERRGEGGRGQRKTAAGPTVPTGPEVGKNRGDGVEGMAGGKNYCVN